MFIAMKKFGIAFALIVFVFGFWSNGSLGKKQAIFRDNTPQINITILLDLSARIVHNKHINPSHAQRDIAIVNHLTEFFKKEMRAKGNI